MFHHWREIWSGQIETTPIWPFVPKQLCFSPFGSDSLVRLALIILLGRPFWVWMGWGYDDAEALQHLVVAKGVH